MISRILLVALVLGSSVSGQSNSVAEIRSLRERSNRAIATHNLAEFSESLDADFVMVRGNGAFVGSKQDYVALFEHDFADPKAVVYRRTPDKIEISSAAPLAAEHGHWVGMNPDGSVGYVGMYLAMWRRTDHGWKIRSELFVVLTCGSGDACKKYAQSKH